MRGIKLCIISSLFFLTACHSTPPVIEICVLNGDGSAECRYDERKYHRETKELENYISTTPDDFQKIIEWGLDNAQHCDKIK